MWSRRAAIGTTGVLCIGIPLVIYLAWAGYLHQRATPPRESMSISEFEEFLPFPSAIVVLNSNTEVRYVVFGDQPLSTFAEYPSGYAFDEDGKLMVWSEDASDIDDWSEYWLPARKEWQSGNVWTYSQVYGDLQQHSVP